MLLTTADMIKICRLLCSSICLMNQALQL